MRLFNFAKITADRLQLPFAIATMAAVESSPWVASIGPAALEAAFADLSHRAKSIITLESEFAGGRRSNCLDAVREGCWVWVPSTGIMEVTQVAGNNVELALIGEAKGPRRRFKGNCLQPTSMARTY